MVVPMCRRRGSAFLNAASSPPTMMERVPLRAPTSPPLTGASRSFAPFDASCFAKPRVADGEIVEWSTTIAPFFTDSMTPPSPRSTFSTSGVSGTQTKTKSQPSAASAGVAAHDAPLPESARAFDLVRVCTFISCPAARRCAAMGWPITPRPMNARRVGACCFDKGFRLGAGLGEDDDEQDDVHQQRDRAAGEQADHDRVV